ncbi:hypothetical protein [Zavarzinia compransoris]|uniref:Uncharacterized protein n=1 Tax=Zavarzinia compransoris TaxID=1264899 RepID=A0A317E9A5_9PROT|nr:hypothetical protein [Zavarzinia compransoris]PWR23311.1 hypothetical protein DKG75_01710 [Zavarzinia compransoris]TDP46118.1 hypothetical protein DES42_104204 [Zavarzinia compransoris]
MTFPSLTSFDDADLRGLGYRVLRVSVFDHWLSAEEAAECPVMNHALALRAGALDAYEAGEARFLALYDGMALTGVTDAQGPLCPATAARTIRDSLREVTLMDIRFPELALRAVGGWDRTDLLLLEPAADLDALTARIRRHGLFVLP